MTKLRVAVIGAANPAGAHLNAYRAVADL